MMDDPSTFLLGGKYSTLSTQFFEVVAGGRWGDANIIDFMLHSL